MWLEMYLSKRRQTDGTKTFFKQNIKISVRDVNVSGHKENFCFFKGYFIFILKGELLISYLTCTIPYDVLYCCRFKKSYKSRFKRKNMLRIVFVSIQLLHFKIYTRTNTFKLFKIWVFFLFSHKSCVIDISFFLFASKWKDQIYLSVWILQSVKNWAPFCKNVLNEWKK